MKYKLVFFNGEVEKILEYGVKDEITTARTVSGWYRQTPSYLQPDHKAKIDKLIISNGELAWKNVSDQVKYLGIDTADMVRFEIKIGNRGAILGGVALPTEYSMKDAVEMIYRGIVEAEPDTVEYSVCTKI